MLVRSRFPLAASTTGSTFLFPFHEVLKMYLSTCELWGERKIKKDPAINSSSDAYSIGHPAHIGNVGALKSEKSN